MSRLPKKTRSLFKASFQGGKALIRLVVATDNKNLPLTAYRQNLAGTFGSFSLGEGNQFIFKRPYFLKDLLLKRIKKRSTHYFERRQQILNAQELATIWHPPGYLLSGIKNIAWGKTLSGEPPENLPVTLTNFTATGDTTGRAPDDAERSEHRREGKVGAGSVASIQNGH